jgi:hypothetical protein
MSEVASGRGHKGEVPAPPARPYTLGHGSAEESARIAPQAEPKAAPQRAVTELSANARSRPVERQPLQTPAEGRSLTSPVSAYAPVSYDNAPAGFMSGRGLY